MYKFVNKKTKVIVFVIDIIGFVLWAILHIFTPKKIMGKRPIPEHPKKILLIRADYIGDVILTTHTLSGIRKRFPESHITFLVSSKSREILDGNPYINNIITYDPPWFFKRSFMQTFREYFNILFYIKRQKFDLAADFRGDVRNILFLTVFGGIPDRISFASSGGWFLLTSIARYPAALHESEYHTLIAETMGADIDKGAMPEIYIGESERAFAKNFLDSHNITSDDMVVVIHQGARLPLKQWPLERYAEVGKYLIAEYGTKVILTGAYNELLSVNKIKSLINNENVIIAAGVINSLKQLKALFEMCSLFIGTSSGPSHLAATANLPTVVISGPESASQWRPIGNKSIIIRKDFPCSPCNEKRCTVKENCIESVKVEDVTYGIRTLLNSTARKEKQIISQGT